MVVPIGSHLSIEHSHEYIGEATIADAAMAGFYTVPPGPPLSG